MFEQRLHPPPYRGTPFNFPVIKSYEWVTQLPANKKIFMALWQGWEDTDDLPAEYDYYILSYHLEAVHLEWIKQQAAKLDKPIVVLFDGQSYNTVISNVTFVSFYYWHEQLRKIQNWFGIQDRTVPNYKFSAICNRVSQSKVWITTKLLETAKDQSLIGLNNWVELKNVHDWQPTGNIKLDNLTNTFLKKYAGKTMQIDNFDNSKHNNQRNTSNPWQPVLTDTAIHFTNESFHYSLMGDYILPGPFVTEKTMKCLLSGTPFIPIGQFETYKTLSQFGLNFDYDFDTAWDNDSGNISRLESIVDLIDHLNNQSIDNIVGQTKHSSQHNQEWINSGKFYQQVDRHNQKSIQQIFDYISH
jgi:hypothetical protein